MNGHQGYTRLEGSSEVEAFSSRPQMPSKDVDGGALFVLESKGNWKHAGFHLTVSIATPALLTLPFALRELGWVAGVLALGLCAGVSFYAYNILSQVLENSERRGHRFLRFRDLGAHVLGPWGYYGIGGIQFLVCFGTVIGSCIVGGQSMKLIYSILEPESTRQLSEFVAIFGIFMLVLAQLPSFHSLRYINLASLMCCLGFSLCVVGGCIYAGNSVDAPPKDYSISGTPASKLFGVFEALAIIATTFGNGIIPEIQATLAPPVENKMFKGLLVCYTVVVTTFFSVAISGYWAFGNQVAGYVLTNLAPTDGPALVPSWLILLANGFALAQLTAVALVYSQPTFEIFEGQTSDVKEGKYSMRNLVPRFLLRSSYVAFATFVSAALPFFGDINGVLGAFCFTPLDFILPFIFYSFTFGPSRQTPRFWIHWGIVILFSVVGFLGCISSVHQVILDAKYYKWFADL
ncbi:GABA transporter 1 isoform X2 [Physcomitrium patens]|uniref:Amino acid transporter transmembrane domain-containing protein n=1 Tax=Physcomitrium patens TaxID=3218 RepID=A0A2K1IJ44_PHYPA|nr:GABA transporter 1-like isoform X2 [Physcomitrium patens]PNR29294.1 hypothetical protein PHYPA_027986 [Physcomitrium patens]|eukprot:XP_024361746.1 GABA transporter 1-like isoform X2 [Physcomitrella patens]